jgi:hypothetical protein
LARWGDFPVVRQSKERCMMEARRVLIILAIAFAIASAAAALTTVRQVRMEASSVSQWVKSI